MYIYLDGFERGIWISLSKQFLVLSKPRLMAVMMTVASRHLVVALLHGSVTL